MTAFAGAIPMLGGLSLRFAAPSDRDFLLELFMAARPWFNWSTLDLDAIHALYEQQWKITREGTGAMYPEHLDFVVEKTGQAVAHLVVDLGYHHWRITQLEVHAQARSKGIGSDVVRSLQAAAAKFSHPLTVSAMMADPDALRFWGRMGFGAVAQAAPMLQLAWFPPGHPALAPAAQLK
jgi:GNAT superfamily N-acetyltransferase